MNIGVIGAGNVGSALGKRWSAVGHHIKFGVRDPRKPEVVELVRNCGPNATAGTVADTASFGEAVAIATPWPATQQAIQSAGSLIAKIVIDCTNPLKSDLSGLAVGYTTSAAELIASWAAGARVVKCFNTTGANNMENPNYGADRAAMFFCGDDIDAKRVVRKLGEDIGFDMVDAGDLQAARLLEPLAMLWIHLAFRGRLGREIAFKLLRR
jgi:predicted dinucleotide-binding enzyme